MKRSNVIFKIYPLHSSIQRDTEFWITRKGNKLLPSQMKTDHLFYSLRMLERITQTRIRREQRINPGYQCTVETYLQLFVPIYGKMKEEFSKRNTWW